MEPAAQGYFIGGRGRDWSGAVESLVDNLEIFGMQLFKNDKLFPYIKPAMLADRPPVTMTLSGHARVVDTAVGKKDEAWKLEIGFENNSKKAILNATQAMNIALLHGEETDEWAGKKIQLYAEHGLWFGKWQYGLRVGAQVPS